MAPERILVCGGRDFSDRDFVYQTLEECRQWFAEQFCIIVGGAKGADKLGRDWAESLGVCCIVVNAPWNFYGLSAGSIRNRWMLNFCKPDLVIAFPGGNGTADMKRIALAAGVPVYAL